MPRPGNTIEKIRRNAFFLMNCASDKLWDPAWGGEDILGLDELVQKCYRALKDAESQCSGEVLALVSSAMFAVEEFYDIPARGTIKPAERPPELKALATAKAIQQYVG